MDKSPKPALLITAALSLFVYCGSVLLYGSAGCTILLSLTDLVVLGGICTALINPQMISRNYFFIFSASTAVIVSCTLGIAVKFPDLDIPPVIRTMMGLILGIFGVIIVASGHQIYNENIFAKFLIFGGFLICIIIQIFFLSIAGKNLFALLYGILVAIYTIASALVVMLIGIVYGCFKHKTVVKISKNATENIYPE